MARYWLPYEEDKLVTLKRNNRPWKEIAQKLSRSQEACKRKWEEVRPVDARPVRVEPLGDEAYVTACKAQGGFEVALVIDGKLFHVRAAA